RAWPATAVITGIPSCARPAACAPCAVTGVVDVLEVGAGIVVGVFIGGGVAWVTARALTRARLFAEVQGREARLAGAERTVDELRKQLSQRDLETTDLRETLAAVQTQRAQAETRWEAARQSVDEQRRLFEEARASLG